MNAQIITTPSGERLVLLAEAEYRAILAAAEEAADVEAIREFRRKLSAGDEELIPAEIVNRILEGQNPIRVWRDHRNLTSKILAEKAGLAQGYLSQLETGKREGTVDTMKKIAEALGIGLEDLVG